MITTGAGCGKYVRKIMKYKRTHLFAVCIEYVEMFLREMNFNKVPRDIEQGNSKMQEEEGDIADGDL